MQRLFQLLALVGLASSCSVPNFDYQSPVTEALAACHDGKLSAGEADVDCGGPTSCVRCDPGKACNSNDDCNEGACTDNTCRAPSCSDGIKNQAESDVDCGGTCDPCASGQSCSTTDDCHAALCTNGKCRESCSDGLTNQDESDVDCGGTASCARCALGMACNSSDDCGKGVCLSNVCTDQTCTDGIKNQNESDLDCGGTTGCERCAPGKACASTDDCNGGACTGGICRAPTCTDGVKNQTESDVDCGGTCDPCANGKNCSSANDCNLALCTGGKCRSQSCADGLINQDESDVDCGGTMGCARCATAQHCLSKDDCNNASCSKGACQAVSCTDSVKNGSETDVDCGSSCSKPCADGLGCVHGNDCTSQVCLATTHICQAPTCTDGVKNGSEPTLDCGATCATKCQLADTCGVANDCASAKCTNSRCVPKAATGTPILMTGWLASASSSFSSDSAPKYAVDGDPNTHWTNGMPQVPGMWFQWDMLKSQVFFSITVTSTSVSSDYGKTLRLSGSTDGTTFTELRTGIAGENTLKITFTDPQIARYLKLETLDSTGGLWWRIDDVAVLQ